MTNAKQARGLLKPHISRWVFDDGNNKLLWKDKAPSVNEVLDILQEAISQSRKDLVEEIIDDLTEKQGETGWCRAFNERLLKKYQDKIISLTKPK